MVAKAYLGVYCIRISLRNIELRGLRSSWKYLGVRLLGGHFRAIAVLFGPKFTSNGPVWGYFWGALVSHVELALPPCFACVAAALAAQLLLQKLQ